MFLKCLGLCCNIEKENEKKSKLLKDFQRFFLAFPT